MHAADAVRDALQAILADMQQALAELEQTLEREHDAVRTLDSAALDRAGSGKQALLARLEQLDAERRQILRAAGLPPTTQGAAWAAIEAALRKCQRLNQRNGGMVNQRLGQVREALSVLTGGSRGGRLYDHSGGVCTGLRSRVLAEA